MAGGRLQRVPLHYTFSAGLDTKTDALALPAPGLLACDNGTFEQPGGISKRFPYTSLGNSIFGGGTLSEVRRIVPFGDELLCFTEDTLYTWSPANSAWVSRGTHLAPKITERTVFARTGDQTFCDRAQLGSVVFYAWAEALGTGQEIYVAAADATTGSTLLAPTSVGADTNRPRLVALTNRVLLFGNDKVNNDLLVKALNPSSLAASVAAGWTTVASTQYDLYYDCCALTSTSAVVVWRRTTTTSYAYATVTETPTVTANTKARACVGPIAVAVSADGTRVAVIRESSAGTILGDILSSTLSADVSTGGAVGTGVPDALAACFRTVADSGQFRCYVFWTAAGGAVASPMSANWINTAGSVGTESVIVQDVFPVARAFDHNGRIFVWTGFSGGYTFTGSVAPQVQNTHFLYRDDGELIASATRFVAGGPHPPSGNSSGYLSGCDSTGDNKFTFCGGERRIINLGGGGSDYADRGPRDITVEFDSNESRRCAQLGRTLYVTGGLVQQFDGEGLTEVGFLISPWNVDAQSNGAGTIEPGTYAWKATYWWENAKGEAERSWSAVRDETTLSGAGDQLVVGTFLYQTKKLGARQDPALEIWRTLKNSGYDSPYYLHTSKDPATTTGDNCYIPNDPTDTDWTWRGDLTDAQISIKEKHPENGGVLPNFPPPPATIIAANNERLFLAGVADDPLAIWYSKIRDEGEVAAFHPVNVVRLPADGGPITALAFVSNVLVAFTEHAIYLLPGEGYTNVLGQGVNYGPPQLVSTDIGALSGDVVTTTPNGVVFQSAKGWWRLSNGGGLEYIGRAIEAYNGDEFTAVHVMEEQHELRLLDSTSNSVISLDTVSGMWSVWPLDDGLHAALWDGDHYISTGSTVLVQASAHSASTDYGLRWRSAWLRPGDQLQGYARVWKVQLLIEVRAAHTLRARIYTDYSDTVRATKTWTVSSSSDALQLVISPPSSYQQCSAISIEVEDLDPAGDAYRPVGISLDCGVRPGFKPLPSARRT